MTRINPALALLRTLGVVGSRDLLAGEAVSTGRASRVSLTTALLVASLSAASRASVTSSRGGLGSRADGGSDGARASSTSLSTTGRAGRASHFRGTAGNYGRAGVHVVANLGVDVDLDTGVTALECAGELDTGREGSGLGRVTFDGDLVAGNLVGMCQYVLQSLVNQKRLKSCESSPQKL